MAARVVLDDGHDRYGIGHRDAARATCAEMTPALRVAVADDSLLVRQGISSVLRCSGLDVVAAVGSIDALVAVADAQPFDVAVVDLRLPPGQHDQSLATMARLRGNGRAVAVLLLSTYVSRGATMRVLSAGPGTGLLLKERIAHEQTLVDAVRQVAAGGSVLDPEVAASHTAPPPAASALQTLSSRELDVVRLMAEGRSNHGIAVALQLSHKTVETHVGRVLAKLGLQECDTDHRRVMAVLRWLGGPG